MIKNILRFWSLFPSKNKKNLLFLVIYILTGSILEFASLGLIIPLVSIVANPEIIFTYLKNYSLFNIYDKNIIILSFIIFFIFLSVLSGFFRTKLIINISNFAYMVGAELNKIIYSQLMHQDYFYHIGLDRNNIINILTSRTKMIVTNVIYPILSLLSSITLSFVIIALLLIIDYKLTFFVSIFISIFYLLIVKFSRTNLGKYGDIVSKNSSLNVQFIRESLSNIKDIKLDNMENFYIENFSQIDKELHQSESKILIIGLVPKYVLESLMMILFGLSILYFFNTEFNFNQMIPFFALLALSAQRLLPQFQQIFYCFSSLKGANSSLKLILDTLHDLKKAKVKKINKNKINFKKSIVLKNIFFKYPDHAEFTLKNINLTIKKGESIGLIGKSGSGKSTLLDIIMGLILPTSGEIFIDGKKINNNNRYRWQANISYVPQSIFLLNKSIKDNIVLYNKKFDHKVLNRILNIVTLFQEKSNSSINNNNFMNRNIGELGEKVSGGQRQKIAIARALYKDNDVIIFDEATSSLDTQSEKIIMDSINTIYLNKTLIMVAHRLSTLSKCDKLYEIVKGVLIEK